MKRTIIIGFAAMLILAFTSLSTFAAKEVLIYTGKTQWIAKGEADKQAKICNDALVKAGVKSEITENEDKVKTWVTAKTNDKVVDVLILYGDLPPTIYPDNNTQKDGSLAELFVETKDGNVIMNHADYMFWGLAGRNKEGGLQNIMDIPAIVMWDDNTPMVVTADGKKITPALKDFQTDRPFHLDQIKGTNWEVEVVLAQNAAGTRADPVIVKDTKAGGRLAIVYQTADQITDPKGEVATQMILNHIFVGVVGVEPKSKLTTSWGSIKRGKF